ncbi:Ankyrin repeat-containing domain [Cinara cedri]|uniref:Ankyrin repeat-containing domain n=1 Tax=Cinara cedri TaxID=506608 RepID=A0A5E4MG13_9HEMI|nr:Ankyrin repeat-containing domain [Cinara cedri]
MKDTKNYSAFSQYWGNYSKIKVESLDTELSRIANSGDVKKFREWVMVKGAVIKSPGKSKSLLHYAVTCKSSKDTDSKSINEVTGIISAVLQSGMDDINHQDENGNTPLMHLLCQAQTVPKSKYMAQDIEALKEKIKFLVERGASFELKNNNQKTPDDLITVLINEEILDNGIDGVTNKAQKSSNLPNQIKEQLSKYIINNGKPIIREVAVYGNYAQIKLSSDGAEVKISEFLQGNFCKNNGISGFSTFYNDDKGGMHGFLSPNGVRNYTVTDGSYEMTLDWIVGDGKCTITINISKDSIVVVDKDGLIVEGRNGLTDEQLKANKYVTINGVSLFNAINSGRNREQKIERESMQEVGEVVSNALLSSQQIYKNKAPSQLDVQRGSVTSAYDNPLEDLHFQSGSDRSEDISSGVISTLTAQLDEQAKSFNVVDGSMMTRLPSESEFQAKVNSKKGSTPKVTGRLDPGNTSPPTSIDIGINTPGTSNVPKLIKYKQYYNNLMPAEKSRNRGVLRGINPKFKELDSGFSSPTDNAKHKRIVDRSVGKEFNHELQGKFTQPNMGLKSPSTSNSQTKQSESHFSSPATDSNLAISDLEGLEAKLLLLKQGQGIEQPFARVLAQMKNKNGGAILKWMENKRVESGLKPAERREMTKQQALECLYLYSADDYSAPAHKGKVREKPTNGYDKNRVGLANELNKQRDFLRTSGGKLDDKSSEPAPRVLKLMRNNHLGNKKGGRNTF